MYTQLAHSMSSWKEGTPKIIYSIHVLNTISIWLIGEDILVDIDQAYFLMNLVGVLFEVLFTIPKIYEQLDYIDLLVQNIV